MPRYRCELSGESPEMNFAFFRKDLWPCFDHDAVHLSKLLVGISYRTLRFVHYIVDSKSDSLRLIRPWEWLKKFSLRGVLRVSPDLSLLNSET